MKTIAKAPLSILVLTAVFSFLLATPQAAKADDDQLPAAAETLAEILDFASADGSLPNWPNGQDVRGMVKFFNCLDGSGNSSVDCMTDFYQSPTGQSFAQSAGIPSWFNDLLDAYVDLKGHDYWGVVGDLGMAAACAVAQVVALGLDICGMVKEIIELIGDVVKAVEDVLAALYDVLKDIVCIFADCSDSPPPEVLAYKEHYEPRICEGVSAKGATQDILESKLLPAVFAIAQSWFDCTKALFSDSCNSNTPNWPACNQGWISFTCTTKFNKCWLAGGGEIPWSYYEGATCSRRYNDDHINDAANMYKDVVTGNWAQYELTTAMPDVAKDRAHFFEADPNRMNVAVSAAVAAIKPETSSVTQNLSSSGIRYAVSDYCTAKFTTSGELGYTAAADVFNACTQANATPADLINHADLGGILPYGASYNQIDRFISYMTSQGKGGQIQQLGNKQWCSGEFWSSNQDRFAQAFHQYMHDHGCNGSLQCDSVAHYNQCRMLMGSVGQQDQCGVNVALMGKDVASLTKDYFVANGSRAFSPPTFSSESQSRGVDCRITTYPNKAAEFNCMRPTQRAACNDHYNSAFGALPEKVLNCGELPPSPEYLTLQRQVEFVISRWNTGGDPHPGPHTAYQVGSAPAVSSEPRQIQAGDIKLAGSQKAPTLGERPAVASGVQQIKPSDMKLGNETGGALTLKQPGTGETIQKPEWMNCKPDFDQPLADPLVVRATQCFVEQVVSDPNQNFGFGPPSSKPGFDYRSMYGAQEHYDGGIDGLNTPQLWGKPKTDGPKVSGGASTTQQPGVTTPNLQGQLQKEIGERRSGVYADQKVISPEAQGAEKQQLSTATQRLATTGEKQAVTKEWGAAQPSVTTAAPGQNPTGTQTVLQSPAARADVRPMLQGSVAANLKAQGAPAGAQAAAAAQQSTPMGGTVPAPPGASPTAPTTQAKPLIIPLPTRPNLGATTAPATAPQTSPQVNPMIARLPARPSTVAPNQAPVVTPMDTYRTASMAWRSLAPLQPAPRGCTCSSTLSQIYGLDQRSAALIKDGDNLMQQLSRGNRDRSWTERTLQNLNSIAGQLNAAMTQRNALVGQYNMQLRSFTTPQQNNSQQKLRVPIVRH